MKVEFNCGFDNTVTFTSDHRMSARRSGIDRRSRPRGRNSRMSGFYVRIFSITRRTPHSEGRDMRRRRDI